MADRLRRSDAAPPSRGRGNVRRVFSDASLNSNASLITGSVCGVKVQEVDDPLMRKIRYLDKLVDELARGKPLEKVLRGSQHQS